jgi:hypothetical protein
MNRRGRKTQGSSHDNGFGVDYELTAKIATEAFASGDVCFSVERIKWLYERGFGQGTTVLSALDDGRKVGQIARINQRLHLDGEPRAATQLVDLFVLQAYRSAPLLRRIYREVERICSNRHIRYVLALPNDKSVLLNERFLKLKPVLQLPVRAGVSLVAHDPSRVKFSGSLKPMTKPEAVELLSGFGGLAGQNGLCWNGDALLSRLDDPTRDYAITADLLLISSSRKSRGIRHTMLCGFFARQGAAITNDDVQQLVRAACRFQKLPVFVYAGISNSLPTLPGVALPARVRPSMLVQLRDFHAEGHEVRFDRFELIDSDFV